MKSEVTLFLVCPWKSCKIESPVERPLRIGPGSHQRSESLDEDNLRSAHYASSRRLKVKQALPAGSFPAQQIRANFVGPHPTLGMELPVFAVYLAAVAADTTVLDPAAVAATAVPVVAVHLLVSGVG